METSDLNQTCSTVSRFNRNSLQSSSVNRFSQKEGLLDSFSKSDVFSLMVEELNELINKLNHLERESSQIHENPRLSYLSDSSIRRNEEHPDILNKKRLLTGKMTDAVLLSLDNPIGVPKYRIQCYEGLASLIEERNNETKQEVQQSKEQLKKLKSESTQMRSQIDKFYELLEEENDCQEKQDNEPRKIIEQFRKAKSDLNTVLDVLYSEQVKTDFVSTIIPLIEAFVNNLENKEEQYIEIPACSLKNKVVVCLIKENIIVRHPSKPRMYCLCMEE